MATRRIFCALAQRRFSIPRPPMGPYGNPGSILSTEIHKKPHVSLAAKCATGSFNSYNDANGVSNLLRRYLSTSSKGSDSHAEEDADSDSEDEQDTSEVVEKGAKSASDLNARVYRAELRKKDIKEANGIGYRIVGPAKTVEHPTTPKDPIFAIIQVGSHQFKVCSGDRIIVEKLKFADVNQKILLNKVLMLGTKSQTIIGRPILPNAAVYALVEEQALAATVIIFKKKRRKNYRRTNFHRQELTTLRIMDIKGLDGSIVETAVRA